MPIYKLYCGRSIPASNQVVTENDFANFLKNQKLFDGFTIYKVEGYWKGDYEKTFILEIVTNDKDKIIQLVNKYKTAFRQESVMVIITEDKTEFI